MKTIMKRISFLLITFCALIHGEPSKGKIVCFYDHKALSRVDLAKVGAEELKPALSMCNYLIYGYVGFDDKKFEVHSLEKDIDLESGKNNFKSVTALKKQFPNVQFLLSVGGFHDLNEQEKYLKVLEHPNTRGTFVTSLVKLVKEYNFDGADLAWQFPVKPEKKQRSTLGSIWHSIKNVVSSHKDDKENEHKEQFYTLTSELSSALRGEKRILTLSVLSHVNAEAYYNVPVLKETVQHVHLMTFDYRTPDRVKDEADYSAPLQYVFDRETDQNVEETVKWWLEQKMPAEKLFITVPTFGISWKITKESGSSGIPPVKKADGPGEAGPYLNKEGIQAYYEICPHLVSNSEASQSVSLLRRVPDSTLRQGTYAFRVPKDKSPGIWISYEEPEVAAKKAQFARMKGLGGVAVYELSLDDFKGSCDNTRTNYPILKAVKMNL